MTKQNARANQNVFSQQADLLNSAFDHYVYWLRWWEMMAASSMTIGLRLSGISYKLQKNQLPDVREMWRMGDEKHAAAMQSLAAIPSVPTGMPSFPAGMQFLQQQSKMQQSLFELWRPFYLASTANAFRLSGTRKPPQYPFGKK